MILKSVAVRLETMVINSFTYIGLAPSDSIIFSSDFNWFYTIEEIFDSYESICQKNGISPIKFNRYDRVEKVPFMETENLKKLHKEIVGTLLDLREHNICDADIL